MMKPSAASLVLLVLLAVCASASAQTYPSRPIRLVVGFAPGGAADIVARTVGDPLGRVLGQSIVIDNRAGAGSSMAAEMVARAAPDGSFRYGLFAHAGTPPEVIRRLFDASVLVMQKPELRQSLARDGTDVSTSRSPEDFAEFLRVDAKLWARIVRESGAKTD